MPVDSETKLQMSTEQALALIDQVERRFQLLREKIIKRRQHFNNDPAVDPDLGDEWAEVISYQTDIPRRVHSKLKARITENHFLVRVTPVPDIATRRRQANDLEQVFNSGLTFVEERERLDIQGFLADGQIIDGLSWLHWRKSDHIWPQVPEYAEADEMPMCPMCEGTGRAAGKRCPECNGTGSTDGIAYTEDEYDAKITDSKGKPKQKGKQYRQTDESLQDQREMDKARAGFPWYIEVVPARSISYVEDKSLEDGFAVIVMRRIVPVPTYVENVMAEKQAVDEYLALNEWNPLIPVYGEVDGPWSQDPSATDYGRMATVVELWTRKEFYEFCDYEAAHEPGQGGSTAGLKFVKGFEHPYEMPPFALCPAMEVNDPDPHNRFLPALEGVFRLKAMYDRLTALMLVLAEQTALPYYYWANVKTGQPMLMEDGDKKVMTFQRDSALAELGPDGYELRKVEFTVNSAFIQTVQHVREELEKAIPSTGLAEISASSQPWTIRLQQKQESVEPGALVLRQARTINTMVRNQAKVMSKPAEEGGFGEKVVVFSRTENGAVDTSSVVGVEPEDITSLDVGVDISAESSAERITLVQHGMELLNANLITPQEFYEDYMGLEDGDDQWATVLATAIYKEQILPMQSKQFVAKWLGSKFVLGPNGEIVGAGGQAVSPAQALQANGIPLPPPPQGAQPPMPNGAMPMRPPMPPQMGGGPRPPGVPGQMGQRMPSLPGLGGPEGVMPLGGMQG